MAPPRSSKKGIRFSTTAVVAVAAVVLVVLAVVWGVALGGSSSNPVQTKSKVAPVSVGLVTMQGRRTQVPLSGKRVTVVEFFAVWCPYCAYDSRWVMPAFAGKAVKAGGRIFAVDSSNQLGQAVPGPLGHPEQGIEGSHLQPPSGQEEAMSLQALAKYKATFHLPFALYYDPGLTYAQAVNLQGYPSFLFYDAKGKAVVGLKGWQTEAQLWQAYQQAARK